MMARNALADNRNYVLLLVEESVQGLIHILNCSQVINLPHNLSTTNKMSISTAIKTLQLCTCALRLFCSSCQLMIAQIIPTDKKIVRGMAQSGHNVGVSICVQIM